MLADYPQFAGSLRTRIVGGPGAEFCQEWDSGQAGPIENEPVVSDVPTLLLAGEFDPITPPAWARQAAETLTNGTSSSTPVWGTAPVSWRAARAT